MQNFTLSGFFIQIRSEAVVTQERKSYIQSFCGINHTSTQLPASKIVFHEKNIMQSWANTTGDNEDRSR